LSFTIAVAGKGGNGKTTICGLIIRNLLKNGKGPVLAVDADANANLGESLGLSVTHTVGGVLASFQNDKIRIPAGLTKEAYLEIKLNEVLVESKELDLLTMGRGEGQDCYCYPNNVLRKFVDSLSKSYKFIVMDNEAGMEHLSRGTTQNVDELLLVSNATVKGVRTIARIKELVAELKLSVKNQRVVINLVNNELDPMVAAELDRSGIVPTVLVPVDNEIVRYDLDLKPLTGLPDSAGAVVAIDRLMKQIIVD
jgi:CO dehydrogenase maturation factor